jgi:alternate signal-mediated exported protein
MNSKIKGAIAAGAATVLLAGGAGTMAAFNGGGSGVGGSVGAGSLALAASGGPAWTDQNGAIDVASYRAVPGDVVTYTASFVVTARGTNLVANLGADSGAITGDPALKAAMATTVIATTNGVSLPSNTGGAVVTPAHNGKTVDVKVVFTFDPATAGAVAQTAQLDLSNFTISLKQV